MSELKVPVSLRVDPALLERIRKQAAKEKRPVSYYFETGAELLVKGKVQR